MEFIDCVVEVEIENDSFITWTWYSTPVETVGPMTRYEAELLVEQTHKYSEYGDGAIIFTLGGDCEKGEVLYSTFFFEFDECHDTDWLPF